LTRFNSSTIQLYSGTGNHSEGQWVLTTTNTLHVHYLLFTEIYFFF